MKTQLIKRSRNKTSDRLQIGCMYLSLKIFCHMKLILDGLMKLLQEIGKAYHALSLYDCKKAVNLFEELPLHQQETCWVMDKIAISYFELGEMDLVSLLLTKFYFKIFSIS